MNDKPNLSLVPDIAHDLDCTLQMLIIEANKINPDKELTKMLLHKAQRSAIVISGWLNN